jgi:hypothetical protein
MFFENIVVIDAPSLSLFMHHNGLFLFFVLRERSAREMSYLRTLLTANFT